MTQSNRQEVVLLSYHHTIAGASSGLLTRLVAQPLDVLKIRFQLQVEPIRKHKNLTTTTNISKYYGIIQAAKLIIKEEGVRALWKGHVPAQALSIVYNSIQFTAFEKYTKLTWRFLGNKRQNSRVDAGSHFICGGLSGVTASIFTIPIDVVRTRIVAQGEPKYYIGIVHAVKCMMKEGGFFTFYKGLVPTLIAIFPYASLQFGFYNIFKTLWHKYVTNQTTSVSGKVESLTCGALSGIISKILLLPLDIVKKRLQIQGFEEGRRSFGDVKRYSGMMDCFSRIFKEEGTAGLYKGLGPSVLKSSLVVALTFFTYEQSCNLLKIYLSNQRKHKDGSHDI